MKLYYCCYGGAHSSVTAANIHLGHLPQNRRATVAEIIGQPLFDRARHSSIGTPVLMGRESAGLEVYALGLGTQQRQKMIALAEALAAGELAAERFTLVNTLCCAGTLMRVGGYASRRLGLVTIGRPLCAAGVWQKYHLFVRLVRAIQSTLPDPAPACQLDGLGLISHNDGDT